jgi:hypothetical protein
MSIAPRIAHATLAALALAAATQAQAFPDGATAPSATELRQRLEGRVFDVQLADGTSWRLQYQSSGYFYIDTSRGFRGDGSWKVEDGRVCSQLRGRDGSCNEMRVHQDRLHMRRDSGEIVRLEPR